MALWNREQWLKQWLGFCYRVVHRRAVLWTSLVVGLWKALTIYRTVRNLTENWCEGSQSNVCAHEVRVHGVVSEQTEWCQSWRSASAWGESRVQWGESSRSEVKAHGVMSDFTECCHSLREVSAEGRMSVQMDIRADGVRSELNPRPYGVMSELMKCGAMYGICCPRPSFVWKVVFYWCVHSCRFRCFLTRRTINLEIFRFVIFSETLKYDTLYP